MKKRQYRTIVIVGIGIALLAIGCIALLAGRGEDPTKEAVPATVSPSPSPSPSAVASIGGGEPATLAFKIDSPTEQVLWQSVDSRIYVQAGRLYGASAEGTGRVLYEWKEPAGGSARAWRNGEYVLVGAQRIMPGSAEEGDRGEWLTVRAGTEPAVLDTQSMFFGPEELLTVTVAEEPRLFVLAMRNGRSFSECVLDPGKGESGDRWQWVNNYDLDSEPKDMEMPVQTDEVRKFAAARRFDLADGSAVYAFRDEAGSLVYTSKPYAMATRYLDYEMTDARGFLFLNRPMDTGPHVLGRFRGAAGDEAMSFVDNGAYRLPVDPRLWEEGWQALDERTFVRLTSEKAESIRFKDNFSLIDNPAQYRELPIRKGRQASAEGTLLKFGTDGGARFASWNDFVNAEPFEEEALLAASLQGYTVLEEPRPESVPETIEGRIIAGSFEDSFRDNANAAVPDELHNALQEAYPDGDYGHSKTFRLVGSVWYVLVDRALAAYQDGKLEEIGELPVTISVEVGEGFGGHGALDFAPVDGGWIVADTEASRVVKLNDRLETVATIDVPMPYGIAASGDGSRVKIDSLAGQWTTDANLKRVDTKPRPFEPSGGKKLESHSFSPQEWYEDPDTGLIWYTFNGWLYQVDPLRKQQRSLYLGTKENAISIVRILPRGDEVRVVLDRKLERFDRKGEWLGTVAYPRVQPDGIYDRTTQGENSLVVDEAEDVLYLAQGYRVLRIDAKRNEVKTIFRQTEADIGPLVRIGDAIYFLLRSREEDRYFRRLQLRGDAPDNLGSMHTQVVRFDMRAQKATRSIAEGFYDDLIPDAGAEAGFALRRYTS